MPDKVMCGKCGLLALRNHVSRTIEEADEHLRKTGKLPDARQVGWYPFCLVQMVDIAHEAKANKLEPLSKSILAILEWPRQCERFTPWHEGFSPKEHREMINEAEIRKLADESRKRDMAFQAEQRQKDKDDAKASKKSDRKWQVFLLVIGAILGYFLRGQSGQPVIHNHIEVPEKSATQK